MEEDVEVIFEVNIDYFMARVTIGYYGARAHMCRTTWKVFTAIRGRELEKFQLFVSRKVCQNLSESFSKVLIGRDWKVFDLT